MEYAVDNLRVEIYSDRVEAARQAAADIASAVNKLLAEKEAIHMIFGAAPSQEDLYAALLGRHDIDWSRINTYHMDEYIGIDPQAPQGFGKFLRDRFFDKAPFRSVSLLRPDAPDMEAEAKRYEALLQANKPDIVCLGIGENGHLAFNDPPADFNDPRLVKSVVLDQVCRQQQVNDGCFAALELVPAHALTLTLPALTAGDYLFCMVPAATKAEAVRRTLEEAVTESCPASVLRKHKSCKLYLDQDSGSRLTGAGK